MHSGYSYSLRFVPGLSGGSMTATQPISQQLDRLGGKQPISASVHTFSQGKVPKLWESPSAVLL